MQENSSSAAVVGQVVDDVADQRPARFGLDMLMGLQRQPHVYGGTVPAAVVRDRRAKGRAARRQNRR